MATYYKNSLNAIDTTGWTTNVVPLTNDLAVYGAAAMGGLTTVTTGSGFPGGSFSFLSDATATSFIYENSVSSTAALVIAKLAGPTPGTGAYSVYIAPSRVFFLTGAIRFGTDLSPTIYVGADGGLALDYNNSSDSYLGQLATNSSGTNAYRISKLGPGWVLTGRGRDPASSNFLYGGVIIKEGAIRLDGGRSASAGYTSPLGFVATEFNASAGATPTLAFATSWAGVPAYTQTSRTLTTGATFTTAGTIDVGSGFTATMQGAFTGSGTFTKSGAGTLSLTGTSLAMPLVVSAGTLQLAASANFTGSTLSGAGTLAMNGGQLGNNTSVDATAHTGQITGTCTILGGVSPFSSNFTGAVTVGGGIVTLSGASSGAVTSVQNVAIATVAALFSTNTGATTVTQSAQLIFSGPNGKFAAGRSITATNTTAATPTSVLLKSGASIANAINATDTTVIRVATDDTSTCDYSGTLNSSGASGSTKVMAKDNGTLVLSGSVTGNAGRTYALNADSGYGGTIRVTGSGFTTSSVTLSRGTLHINRAGSVGVGSGLTLNAGTLACSSPSTAAYAAQINGAVTFAAGTTFKFGAPA